MIRFMSIAEREAYRRDQEQQREGDVERSQSKFRRLFGDLDTAPDAPKVEHVTRIERGTGSYTGFIFRCSCHAFGTWHGKRELAEADAKAHVAKPWVKR